MASVGCVAGSRSAQEPRPNQLVARLNIEHQSIWGASHAHQMEILQVNEQITPITTIKRHRAAGRVRHRPRSLTTAGVEVRSSSRTSTSTRNPRPTPGHPHPTQKSRYAQVQIQWDLIGGGRDKAPCVGSYCIVSSVRQSDARAAMVATRKGTVRFGMVDDPNPER